MWRKELLVVTFAFSLMPTAHSMVLHICTLKQLILTCKAITPTSSTYVTQGTGPGIWFWISLCSASDSGLALSWLALLGRSLAFYHALTESLDFLEGQGNSIHSHHLATTVRQILCGFFAWAGSKVNNNSEYQETYQ